MPWRMAAALGLYSVPKAPLQFVIENADWAIRWVGEHIRDEIEVICPGAMQTTAFPQEITESIVHFGSQYMWLDWGHLLSSRNRFVTSFFHGKPEDGADVAQHIEKFLASVPRLSRIVTASGIVEQRLLQWGVPREKLVRIPIGVDTRTFVPPTANQRQEARRRFGIPDNTVVIGSFQKDGVGWSDGMEPKLIKGPDVYVEAMAVLKAAGIPVMAFLSGPARGFVKQELNRFGIPLVHTYIDKHSELVECYHALDLYLVTSREEGGPMGLMESMASGVPVVSTEVGMAPDLITDGVNGGLAGEACGDAVANKALSLLALPSEKLFELKQRAREAVMVADWAVVGNAHWEKVYQPLLQR